tara:strand:+ start:177 stop:1271 length:1095 start_codon:yes stop_codon:yes gene_type:complete
MLFSILQIFPGVFFSFIIAYAGIYLSGFIGNDLLNLHKSPISPIMLSIIIGLLIGNIIRIPSIFSEGIKFSLKFILRFGIICLGIRLGLLDILKVGIIGIPLIVACILISIFIVNYFCKLLDVSSKMGSLIAVGTSICGATAIVATSPTINADKEEIAYAIANITIFGIIAMFIYPFLAHYLFDGDELSIGLFLGTSIHETAQVAGAGLIYSEQYSSPSTMDIATITKLVRNISMIVVIPFISYLYFKNNFDKKNTKPSILSMFPIFIIGFIIMGLIRSIGDYGIQNYDQAFGIFLNNQWQIIIDFVKFLAEYLLAIAMAAVGVSTNLISLRSLGIKPFYVGFSAAVCVGLVSYIGIIFLNYFI